MQQVWKYELQVGGQNISMPEGAEILAVQAQGEIPCIWVLVNPSNSVSMRYFEIYGTGHNIQIGERKYIGTFQLNNGYYIYHVFELI